MAEGSSSAPKRLEPRGDRLAPLVFKQGSHAPYGIRWYGATSLWGHFRNFVSTAIARESVDSRDWMRPLDAREMLANVTQVLGVEPKATLLESLGGRPLWIDWIADTGDDRDVSEAVAHMVFDTYVVDDGGTDVALPRGDVLLFGGDTAYPVATTEEIYRRLVQPWNDVLRHAPADGKKRRVLLGIPGNHDWYDGLDGFGRLFRRRAPRIERDGDSARPPPESHAPSSPPRSGVGRLARRLHIDELRGTIDIFASVLRTVSALWSGKEVEQKRRLAIHGYDPVQESSFWALPLAPGLELWGVDRQLGRIDYRQRAYFRERREAAGQGAGIWFVAPDPAIAHGDAWGIGERMLRACGLSLERDRILYQCGDMHHYERRTVRDSTHVIAGGGGAFLHGTRIVPDPQPAQAAYPDARTTRRLALQVPLKLTFGRSGWLVHMAAGLVAALELGMDWRHWTRTWWVAGISSVLVSWALYAIAGHHRAHPRRVLAMALPFGIAFGCLPSAISGLLRHFANYLPLLGRDAATVIVYAFVGAALFGTFLWLCALQGLEMQQVFTVLGHPGFKHFVRMRVSPDGTIDAWTIGKDDPLQPEGPWLIDRWTWRSR
ncbi:MAG TPA: hypothetical protein VF765_18085 [Polyangiaceae bacterium]